MFLTNAVKMQRKLSSQSGKTQQNILLTFEITFKIFQQQTYITVIEIRAKTIYLFLTLNFSQNFQFRNYQASFSQSQIIILVFQIFSVKPILYSKGQI